MGKMLDAWVIFKKCQEEYWMAYVISLPFMTESVSSCYMKAVLTPVIRLTWRNALKD